MDFNSLQADATKDNKYPDHKWKDEETIKLCGWCGEVEINSDDDCCKHCGNLLVELDY